jgi:hypothetical protein
MAVSYKAQSLANDLLQSLNQRFGSAATTTMQGVWTLGADTDGYPLLTSVGAAGTQSCLIKVNSLMNQVSIFKDSLGNAAYPFSPSVIQVVLEQLAGNTGTTVLKALNLLRIVGELAIRGANIELYLSTNTTVPAVGGITGTPVAVFNELQYPGVASN